MKMKPEDFEILKDKINAVYAAHKAECITHKATHTPVRYAFDMFHALRNTDNFKTKLYHYLNDDHIQTALLQITKTH